MDIYGIGTALRFMFSTYRNIARSSGRSTHMISCMRDGDVVLVKDPRARLDVQHRARAAGKTIKIEILPAAQPIMFSIRESMKRLEGDAALFLDHAVVERYYEVELWSAEKDLNAVRMEMEQRLKEARDFPIAKPIWVGAPGNDPRPD